MFHCVFLVYLRSAGLIPPDTASALVTLELILISQRAMTVRIQ